LIFWKKLGLFIGKKTYETFHLSEKILAVIDLLQSDTDSDFAKADAQFFKMIGGMPSGSEPLLTSKSCKTLSTSSEVN
jgi:hypothetical protein